MVSLLMVEVFGKTSKDNIHSTVISPLASTPAKTQHIETYTDCLYEYNEG